MKAIIIICVLFFITTVGCGAAGSSSGTLENRVAELEQQIDCLNSCLQKQIQVECDPYLNACWVTFESQCPCLPGGMYPWSK